MKVFHAEAFTIPLPRGHRFPIGKYRQLYDSLRRDARPDLDFIDAPAAERAQLTQVHTADYVDGFCAGSLASQRLREIGFPWSAALVERSRRSVGATIAAAAAAQEDGIAASLAGGTHHARADGGAGFCVFNDIAVAASVALDRSAAERVLVIDCDVHQGDGTARIFAGEARVYTLSIHSARNYPLRKAASDLDLALPDGTADEAYLEALHSVLDLAWRAAQPTLCFYQAGADVYAGDRLGRLALSVAGIAARDRCVIDYVRGRGIPLAIVMGGGYAPAIEETVAIHRQTIHIAADACVAQPASSRPSGADSFCTSDW